MNELDIQTQWALHTDTKKYSVYVGQHAHILNDCVAQLIHEHVVDY